ncbi:MAG: NAD(P)H-hydrate dehydratase [Clostridiales bacterium]|nr:NAD(P)H-hydrate dehydratase [Clostridiales bacterium]
MRLVTAEEMRMADKMAIEEYGVPSMLLMENAGLAIVRQAEAMLGSVNGKKVAVFCGGGNNGGDGLVAARHLYNRGCDVRLYFVTDPDIFRGDSLTNWQILKNMGVSGYWLTEGNRLNVARMALASADLAIDAIFGTGLNDNVSGVPLAVIDVLNESNRPIISCDIPSGLSAELGLPLGTAVKATVTVSFGFCKQGLVLPTAAPYVGSLLVADISLPAQVAEGLPSRRELIDVEFCSRWLKPRDRSGHKGDFGHILMLAGSPHMPGAAIMAASGAMRAGVGRLTAAIPSACRLPFAASLPEAMLLNLPENEAGLILKSERNSISSFKSANCFLIGPGLGRNDETLELVRDLLPYLDKPTVLDADGLFAVCGYLSLLKSVKAPLVITPHPGEMAQLLGVRMEEVQGNRIDVAAEFAKQCGVIVVLKGAGTVIATPEGRIFLNNNGNPGMAVGGSGDVLAGMVAALLAQGLAPAAATGCAVWLHGMAGDLAAAAGSEPSLMPRDLLDHIGAAYKQLTIDN